MVSKFTALLSQVPVITDGAWGTRLQQLGLKSGECPDSWNIQYPEKVELVAREYVEAGCQVILTNTFRSNRIALEMYGLGSDTPQINRMGVEISKGAAGSRCLVFASIGPTGKILLSGDVTETELREIFEEQAGLLKEGGADALIIETMSDLEEAKIALQAAKKTQLPVGVSMVFDAGKEKDRTMMGNPPEQVVEELTQAGADFIGANCGQGIDGFISICQRMKAVTQLPIWMKPNAGLPEWLEGEIVYRTTPAEFVSYIDPLVRAGATFIGGCCGTSPEFIKAIRESVKNYE
jgi:5-methyltetrahydrofolate--homocysteine methyltransferase